MFPALPSSWITRARSAPRRSVLRGAGVVGAGVALALATGCGVLSPGQNGDMPTDISVTSALMQQGEPLPDAYACGGESEDGEAVSPPVRWSGLPDGVGSIALVVDDPQAAEVFWVVFDLDPQLVELRQNTVPADAKQALNSAGEARYGAPCPTDGDVHEYRFTVYALDAPLDLPDGAELGRALEAIADQAVARGSLVVTSE
ncbi:YbhB/YbcL family Raf kinase inhibitor-like protein [Nocardiopsis sp. FIRDI 009]|uniref:YbhB/YbcL family Raf kinase inhibitor-like protein n=1 Tax=Nocardiopsis sp. FIRDI 009 TaxID=714197 RepID=UPI000E24723F|nr:YbhB/YbcL family Raf kinase inhibitor-like protein [Nocardiopsis sp. FIRDI 009]